MFFTFFIFPSTLTAHLQSLLKVASSISYLTLIEIMFLRMYSENLLFITLRERENWQN